MADNKRPWSPPQMVWSALIAIVAWSAIGFNWFGTGFGWKTESVATQLTSTAVTDQLALICVAQARNAPDAESALKAFAELQSWKQKEFIESAKWATMPGSESSQSGVAELCATKLRET